MRSILVWLFYLWLAGSIVALVRRRKSTGTFRPQTATSIVATEVVERATVATPPVAEADTAPVSLAVKESDAETRPTPAPPTGRGAESLAEALSGVTMPCDLVPFSTGDLDPRYVAFSTTGHSPAAAVSALSEEFERLGFGLTTVDDRTIHAVQAASEINIKLMSAALDSPGIMEERFPMTGADALVVELRLR